MFSLKYKELQAITEDWVDETLNFRGYTTNRNDANIRLEVFRWMKH
jgi:hypothetical protein